jgi:hypothetical protein
VVRFYVCFIIRSCDGFLVGFRDFGSLLWSALGERVLLCCGGSFHLYIYMVSYFMICFLGGSLFCV